MIYSTIGGIRQQEKQKILFVSYILVSTEVVKESTVWYYTSDDGAKSRTTSDLSKISDDVRDLTVRDLEPFEDWCSSSKNSDWWFVNHLWYTMINYGSIERETKCHKKALSYIKTCWLEIPFEIIFPDQTNLPDRTDLTGQYQLTLSDRRCDLNNARWKVCISVCLSVCITVRLVVYSALSKNVSTSGNFRTRGRGGGGESVWFYLDFKKNVNGVSWLRKGSSLLWVGVTIFFTRFIWRFSLFCVLIATL